MDGFGGGGSVGGGRGEEKRGEDGARGVGRTPLRCV